MSPTGRRKKAVKELSGTKKQALVSRLMGNRSCAGCEYLYFQDVGWYLNYSDCSVTDMVIHCALDRNPNLKDKEVEVPYDWRHDLNNGIHDRWGPTCNSMCERFTPLKQGASPASFDVDGETKATEKAVRMSRAACRAIAKHSGR